MNNTPICVILADGDFPKRQEMLRLLTECDYLCCCDNAGRALIERHGIMPHAIVGDGDSLPQDFKERYANIYHQIDEQDYNDLTKATRHCQALGYTNITYLGATGKREDHTLGNISLLSFYQRELGVSGTMITDHGTFTAHQGDATIPTFPRQQVSIFNISCTRIESEGLRWQSYAYRELWQGTLNEATGDAITLRTDGEYIIFRSHEAKQ